jgi:cellulase/cellobiase CelA1
VIQNASYDGTIAPGQAVSFGFQGTPGHAFTPPTNYILNGVAVGTPPPPLPTPLKAAVTFTDVNDWGTGFTGSITITNTGTTAIQGWTLQFDFGASITSIWNANLLSQSGTAFTIQDAGYNETIAPGQSVTFGFNGSPGHVVSGPTNYVLNGVRLG